ncbi:MAG: hypothetical protein U9Q76_03795 [candidate division WOR-3 bacterium]|nr:hypothetical protein [candidate division WOR-3 bacterium]
MLKGWETLIEARLTLDPYLYRRMGSHVGHTRGRSVVGTTPHNESGRGYQESSQILG